MISIDFHNLAEQELLTSRDYYDNLVFGLGKKFVLEVEQIINMITSTPLTFPVYFKNYRKALLRKFPYFIIYKVDDNHILFLQFHIRKENRNIGLIE
ncbi:MAG: hypothetical protein A2068_14280 [Ignavibacteria bacterium GWB2_35_6b]|nr:MAG: hypothetical protein A2068_14280 [Ignavibacteria bacterium GWB2_35_6b]